MVCAYDTPRTCMEYKISDHCRICTAGASHKIVDVIDIILTQLDHKATNRTSVYAIK